MNIDEIIDGIYLLPQTSKDMLLASFSEVEYPKRFRLLREDRKGAKSYFIRKHRTGPCCLAQVSKTAGTEKALWIAGTVSSIALSLFIVTKVLKTLPIGTAYAIWTGIGAVGTVLIGIIFFR